MLRTPSVRVGIVAAAVTAAALALAGCQGTTSPAPTPVRSTDLTSSDGGFDEHAVVGVLLRADRTGTDTSSGTSSRVLGSRFADALTEAGFRPDVRTASRADPGGSGARALRELVRTGAKAVFVEAQSGDEHADRLDAAVQYAHDAGVVVIALADPVPGADDPGDGGVAADYRIDGDGDGDDAAASLVERAVTMVRALQRGEEPTGD